MSKNKLFMSIILMMLVFPIFASAQVDDGLLGGIDKSILKTFRDILTYEINIPAAQIYSDKTTQELTMPVWLLFAGFAVIYSILWLASGMVPLFKGDESRRVRMFFVIAVTLITMFVTPVMYWIVQSISAAATVTYLFMLVLVFYTIWTIFRSGWASNRMQNSQSSKNLADASQLSAEAARMTKQTENFRHKTAQAAATSLKKQTTAIRQLRNDLGNLLGDFLSIRKAGTYPPGKAIHDKVLRDIGKISTDAGKILTFKTETDRILAGMKANDYKEAKGAGSLSVTTSPVFGSRKAEIEEKVDSETNDLGRSISSIATALRGTINAPVLNNIIGWTEASINITNQMERDIVLEEQMIEKL